MSIQQTLAMLWILAVGGNLLWLWGKVHEIERRIDGLEKTGESK